MNETDEYLACFVSWRVMHAIKWRNNVECNRNESKRDETNEIKKSRVPDVVTWPTSCRLLNE